MHQQSQDQFLHGASRHPRGYNSWWIGLTLIAVGLIFLLQSVTIFNWVHWWALLLLMPLGAVLWSAWDTYRQDGNRFARHLTGRLSGAAYLFFAFVFIIFNLDWSAFWPVFVILVGLSALLSTTPAWKGLRGHRSGAEKMVDSL